MLLRPIRLAATSLATLAAFAGGAAAETGCPMTYAQFEFAVPHLDLETCPAALEGEGRFCRAAAGADALHVFAFAEAGEQCLVGMASLDEAAFTLAFE